MRGLYAIIDVETLAARSLPILDVARAIVEGRPTAVQLRAKDTSPRETLALLRALRPLCRDAGVLLFANDRPDLAVLAGCDGVHVGQEDLPVATVRRIAPHLRIGISTHNPEQVAQALREQPDYLAFGPVFTTRSKARPDPVVGLVELANVTRQSAVPVVAIGGIDLERAPAVAERAAAGAVIAALLPQDVRADSLEAITVRARALDIALRGKTPEITN